MAEVVDSIVAEMILRIDNYERNADKIVAKHKEIIGSLHGLAAGQQQYQDKHAKSAGKVAIDEEQATAKITRTRKARTDAGRAQDEAEVASAKRAAKEKEAAVRASAKAADAAAKAEQRAKDASERASVKEAAKARQVAEQKAAAAKLAADAVVAAAEREIAARVRISAMVDRSLASGGVKAGSGRNLGVVVPRERSGQVGMPASVMAGVPAVAEESAINHLLVDRAALQSSLTFASKAEAAVIRDKLAEIALIDRLQKAGVAEADIALQIETRRLAVERARVNEAIRNDRRSVGQGASQFGRNALGGRSVGAIGGIASAAALFGIAAAIESSLELGKTIKQNSEIVGLSTKDWQVYAQGAKDAGVSNEQLATAFGALQENIGKAKAGSQEQVKLFKALGINIKDVSSAGDLLPTLIDRISSIKDPAQRAAVEVAFLGETGRKLDGMLSGGNAKINELAAALEKTGRILSDKEIKDLDQTAKKLAEVKAQLQIDFAHVVADNADSIRNLATALGQLASGIISFLGADPARAIALIGGLAGLPFGPAGVVVGAGVGYFVGNQMEDSRKSYANGSARIGPNGKISYFDKDGKPTAAPAPQRSATGRYTPQYRTDDEGNRIELPVGTTVPKAAGTGSRVQNGKVDLGALANYRAPKPPRGRRGPDPDTLAREAEAREQRFKDQLFSYQQEQLRAQAQMTGDIATRAAIEERIAANELAHEKEQIDSQAKENALRKGADKKVEDTRAGLLKAAATETETQAAKIRQRDTAVLLAGAEADMAEQVLNSLAEQVQAQLDLARTTKDRRALELRLLEIQKDIERIQLGRTRDSALKGSEEEKRAQSALDTLDVRSDIKEQAKQKSTLGPLASAIDKLPRTADDINEALEQAAANGLQNLNDGLTDTVAKFLHLHGLAGQFLKDLIDIGIRREILLPLANILFPTQSADAGASGSGSFISSAITAIGSIFGGHRAGGGPVMPGQVYEVGERGRELFSPSVPGAIIPNHMVNAVSGNARARSVQPQVTVMAPLHFDLSNAVMTPELLQQMDQISRYHAQNYGAAFAQGAVRVSEQQGPGIAQRAQKLGTMPT